MENPPDRHSSETPYEEDQSPAPEVSVKRIQIINVCILLVACLASLAISREFAVGIIVGGILMAANFVIITAVIRSVFLKGETSVLSIGIYWAKFVGVLVLVGVLILVFRIDVIGFLVGLSTILLAITTEAVLRLAGK
jgi:hypothetical protein